MKILMTSTVQGSLDGETVQELEEGKEYEPTDRLARYHIKRGVAILSPTVVAIDKPVKPKVSK